MIEVLLSEDALQLGLQKARNELSDFLESTKTSLTSNGESQEVKRVVRDSLDIYVSSYYSLIDALQKSSFFSKEAKKDIIIWNYAVSCASTALLNFLEHAIGREICFDPSSYGLSPINPDDLRGQSAFTLLSNSLTGLRSYVKSSGKGGNMIYKLGFYFSNLESIAGYEARMACSERAFNSELSKICPRSGAEKISFRLKNRQKLQSKGNGNQEEPVLVGDKLPDELQEYTQSTIRLSDVVGNSLQKLALLEYVSMVFHYHVPSQENFLWMDGNGFPEGVLLYGDAGVGKTFTANAVMNEALLEAKKRALPFTAVALSGQHISSVYQNRSGAVLEHYLNMIRQGDKILAVFIDEFDDLIPLGNDGKLSENARQRLSAFKRATGNSSALGNYFIIAIANRIDAKEDIPPEITDRLKPLYIPGPQSPEEYGQIIRNGLKFKESLGLVDKAIDWAEVGNHILEWKKKIDGKKDKGISIGRGYKLVTQQLATRAKKPFHQYSQAWGKSPQWQKQFYQHEFMPVNHQALFTAIDNAMNDLLHAKTHTKPGEYGITNPDDIPMVG